MKKRNKSIIITLYFVILIYLNVFVVSIGFVFGNSMEPSYFNGDIVLIYKWKLQLKEGDVVITNRNNPYEVNLIKRVVAVADQSINISEETLRVDERIISRYNGIIVEDSIEEVLPEKSVYLIGDNFNYSRDSREIGSINTEDILGKVIYKLF